MTKEIRNNGRPEGGIYEQFGYLPKLVVYLNSSDIDKLSEIAPACNQKTIANREVKNDKVSWY